MIVFDLFCDQDHRFEGWFGSSSEYADQRERGLLACPQCGSLAVDKAPMAPAVPVKGNRAANPTPRAGRALAGGKLPPEVTKAVEALAQAQHKALKDSTWVGDKFADQSRAMHYGEQDEKPIHGKASLKEAKALVDEGIEVAPLPLPVAPPDEVN